MAFYDREENIEEYIRMSEGYDGRELIERLKLYLPRNSHVLELGMGPGKDLRILGEYFAATGSDNAALFVDRYRRQYPEADVLLLDALDLNIERRFDAIYSNKVLYHLTREELELSLHNQSRILNEGGIILHSFWHGEEEEIIEGLRCVYYTEEMLERVFSPGFAVLEMKRYTEMTTDDSLFILARLH